MKLYSIGQVSHILAMPVKTIRYYDELGLCSPTEIDPESGYRHYSLDDIVRLDMIRCLGRVLGMPLRAIGEFLENNADQKLLTEYLRQQEQEIDAEIDRLLERRMLLSEKLNAVIRTAMTSMLTPSVTNIPERKIFIRPQSADSTEQGLFAVRQMVSSSIDVDKHKLYILKKDFTEGGEHFTWDDFIAGTDYPSSEPDCSVLTLAEGPYAVISYINNAESRANAFSILSGFVDRSGYLPDGPLVFVYDLLDVSTITVEGMHLQLQIRLRRQDASP